MVSTACSPRILSVLWQLGSEVLNQLPLYRRLRSYSHMAPADPGAKTSPPGYYDGTAVHPDPDTGAERLFQTLLGDDPASAPLPAWPTPTVPPPPPPSLDCDCFSCFQQHHLYLLWQHNNKGTGPLHHSTPLPKSLLHRITASLVVTVFTAAFVVYPHVKTALTGSYTWERRHHVVERVLEAVVCVWTLLLWTLGLATEVESGERWLMRVGGEVLGGVLDGTQVGVGVWGSGVSG